MASNTHDDAFHEIQLNGKQLFFLFMSATVVSVVIFLCGVLVGRGVRTERNAVADASTASPSADAPPPGSEEAAVSTTGADPAIVLPPPPAEEIAEVRPNVPIAPAPKAPAQSEPVQPKAAAVSAVKPVTVDKPAASKSEPPAARPEPPAGKPEAPARPAPAETSISRAPVLASSSPGASAPDSSTWSVQVAALKTGGDADKMAQGLKTKGFSGYVVSPTGGFEFYRVRVGPFKTRNDADAMVDKLKSQGLKPYVTH